MSAVPRVVVSAPSSGHGKTALAVGLLAAFAGRGLRRAGSRSARTTPTPPTWALAAGAPGRNLDPRLVGAAPGRAAVRARRRRAPTSRSSRARWACSTASPAGSRPTPRRGSRRRCGRRWSWSSTWRDGPVGGGAGARLPGVRRVALARRRDPQPGRLRPARATAARGARRHRRAGLRRAAPPRPAGRAAAPPATGVVPACTGRSRRCAASAGSARRSPARSTSTGCSRWPARRRDWRSTPWSPRADAVGAPTTPPPCTSAAARSVAVAGARRCRSRYAETPRAARGRRRRASSRSTRCATRGCRTAPTRW